MSPSMTTVQTLRTPRQAAPLLACGRCEYDGMSGYLNQGIAVATGLQDHFSWRQTAAAAVGAGVGQAVAQPIGEAFGKAFGDNTGSAFAARIATRLAAGTATAVMRGGHIAV